MDAIMKRTVPATSGIPQLNAADLQVLSEILNRRAIGTALGYQYSGDRDIYEALGYKKDLVFTDFLAQYTRQDIAAAVINRPVDATWRGNVGIIESNDDNDTALELAWTAMEKQLHLKSQLIRLDKLTGIGRYAVLFLGFSDAIDRTTLSIPVSGKNLKLLYVRPLSEINATIQTWETNTANARYGLPLTYSLTLIAPGSSASETLTVHYTRVLHVADGLLEGSVIGVSRLAPVFNRLKDLEKLVGGSAEMFWRGARPGYHGNISPDVVMTDAEKDKLREQMNEYEHNLRRMLIGSGVEFTSLDQQVADPAAHVDVQIQMISAITGIPKRILTGSERGELASSEDKNSWLDMIQGRREEWAAPFILLPLINTCISYGVLPPASTKDGFTIEWSDLWSPSDEQRAKVGQMRAQAISQYAANPYAMDVLPPEAFYKWCLGLDDEEVQLIIEMQGAALIEDGKDTVTEEEEVENEDTESAV